MESKYYTPEEHERVMQYQRNMFKRQLREIAKHCEPEFMQNGTKLRLVKRLCQNIINDMNALDYGG